MDTKSSIYNQYLGRLAQYIVYYCIDYYILYKVSVKLLHIIILYSTLVNIIICYIILQYIKYNYISPNLYSLVRKI